MFALFIMMFLAIVYWRIVVLSSRTSPPNGHWHHHFENFNYSPHEFYEVIKQAIREKEIPGVEFQRVVHAEGGKFSMQREYLRITRKRMVFDICAAPFAKGFFVSWWQVSLPSPQQVAIALIPILGRSSLRHERERTYFEIDTEKMFQDTFHECIMKAIDAITSAKGLRSLSNKERLLISEPLT